MTSFGFVTATHMYEYVITVRFGMFPLQLSWPIISVTSSADCRILNDYREFAFIACVAYRMSVKTITHIDGAQYTGINYNVTIYVCI